MVDSRINRALTMAGPSAARTCDRPRRQSRGEKSVRNVNSLRGTVSRLVALASTLMQFTFAAAHSEDWPGWRGPRGDGTSVESNVSAKWNGASGENVVWKTPLPG